MTARILKYNFPSVNNTISAVCALQTVVAGPLILNGTFVDPVTGIMSFKNKGYSRSVSFSSANDLGAARFTINGIENGNPITEDVTGPDAAANPITYSNATFDTIISILVNIPVNGISVGGGVRGFFGPLGGNVGVGGFPVWGVSITPIAEPFVGGVRYYVDGSLDNIVNTYNYDRLIQKGILLNYDGISDVSAPNHSISFSPATQLVIQTLIDDGGVPRTDFTNDEFTFIYYVPGQ